MKSDLLSDIEAFLVEADIEPVRFGVEAVRNGRLVERLRDTAVPRRVWPETEVKIRSFMLAHKGKRFGHKPLTKPRRKPIKKAKSRRRSSQHAGASAPTPKTEAASLT